jgi:hypothetical protein
MSFAKLDSIKVRIAYLDSLWLVSTNGTNKVLLQYTGTNNGSVIIRDRGTPDFKDTMMTSSKLPAFLKGLLSGNWADWASGGGGYGSYQAWGTAGFDTTKLRNPSNNTVVSIVNSTSTSDTTINILALGGGASNIGVVGVMADETRTDTALVADTYLIATMAGTTSHSYAYGGVYAGYIDLFVENPYTPTGIGIGFTLPDPAYTVMNVYADYFYTMGDSAVYRTTPITTVVSDAKTNLTWTDDSHYYRYVRLNWFLDNRYGYSGQLKFLWAAPPSGTTTKVLAATTLVGYRLQ